MKKLLLAIVFSFSLVSTVTTTAFAQCTGWPVHCTGINPATGGSLGPSIAASAGVAVGFYSLGEAIGIAIFGDIDKALQVDAAGGKIFDSAIAVYANNSDNCRRAEPRFVLAEAYYAKAHQMVPINIGINRNLTNVHAWVALCGEPGDLGRQGNKLMQEGDALLEKHQCRQALLKWAQAKPYFDRAASMAGPGVIWAEHDQSNIPSRLERLKNGGYAQYGCTSMQIAASSPAATLSPSSDPRIKNAVDEARKAHVPFDPFALFERGALLAEAPKCPIGSRLLDQNCVRVDVKQATADDANTLCSDFFDQKSTEARCGSIKPFAIRGMPPVDLPPNDLPSEIQIVDQSIASRPDAQVLIREQSSTRSDYVNAWNVWQRVRKPGPTRASDTDIERAKQVADIARDKMNATRTKIIETFKFIPNPADTPPAKDPP
jgi:hypothetical protein